MIRLHVTSVMVDDQEKALAFYTTVLGFVKKTDVPAGGARWLTVVPAVGPTDVELLLDPLGFEPARTYQKALYDAGIAATSFATDDLAREHARTSALGVAFRMPPTSMGPVTIATFDDTCGNLIQLVQL
jgi:catechol 2,3-dioxygenase-like lactoylglutathione lyase family enzyme